MKSNAAVQLQQLIRTKEDELELERRLLKITFQSAIEKLKPINIIKNSIKEVITAPNLQNNIINNVIGLASGFLTKKLIVGKTHNPISKLLGMLIEVGVANKVTANADGIKSIASLLLNKVMTKNSSPEK